MEKEYLINEKIRIEEEIKKAEKKELNKNLLDVLSKLEEIEQCISNLQSNINHIWKRTEQLKEEISSLIK